MAKEKIEEKETAESTQAETEKPVKKVYVRKNDKSFEITAESTKFENGEPAILCTHGTGKEKSEAIMSVEVFNRHYEEKK